MTGRLKLLAAALGLILATGTVAEVSAKTMPDTNAPRTQTTKTIGVKTVRATKTVQKGYRFHVAKGHRLHALRHLASHRDVKPVAKTKGETTREITRDTKVIKQTGTAHRNRDRLAMNHRVTKATSVVR